MGNIFIYTLSDPRTSQVRYVGKTKDPKLRLRMHVNSCRKGMSRRHRWLCELADLGIKPTLEVLEEIPEEGWEQREIHWIAFYRSIDADLVNTSRGGGRTSHEPCSEATKARLSAANKGKVLPPEVRAKISQALRGVRHSPERKARRRGRKASDETRAKMSAAKKGIPRGPMSDSTKKKVSVAKANRPRWVNSESGFKCVAHLAANGGKSHYWQVKVHSNGQCVFRKLFPFTNEGRLEAARAANAAYSRLFPEAAPLNPDVDALDTSTP